MASGIGNRIAHETCFCAQKFGGRKSGASNSTREEPAPATSGRQAPNAAASPLDRRPSLAGRGSAVGPGPGSVAGREKPGLPALSEEGCRAIYAEPLPTFRDVPAAEKQLLFVRKLHLCAYTFDFTDQARNVREKEIKRQTLLELVDYVNQGAGKFTEAVAEDIVFMLSNNLFRALPPTKSHDQDNLDPDEEEPALEPAWPHLQVLSCALGHGAGVDVHCGCGIACSTRYPGPGQEWLSRRTSSVLLMDAPHQTGT